MSWPDEHIEYLKGLHELSFSAGQMTRMVNEHFAADYTRNAIIGKIKRLSLGSIGGGPPPPRPNKERRRRKVAPRLVPELPQEVEPMTPEDDLKIPREQRRSLIELESHHCHWPVGDVRDPGFFFCGAQAVPDEPYCAAHCRRAYNSLAVTERQAA